MNRPWRTQTDESVIVCAICPNDATMSAGIRNVVK